MNANYETNKNSSGGGGGMSSIKLDSQVFHCTLNMYDALTHYFNVLQSSRAMQWHCGNFMMIFKSCNRALYDHFFREAVTLLEWVPVLLSSLLAGRLQHWEDLLQLWDYYLADLYNFAIISTNTSNNSSNTNSVHNTSLSMNNVYNINNNNNNTNSSSSANSDTLTRSALKDQNAHHPTRTQSADNSDCSDNNDDENDNYQSDDYVYD